MDFNDASDLLGNNEMPVRQQRWWSLLLASFYFVLYTSGAIAVVLAYVNGRSWLRDWREYNYRKSVRRKYGIPDSNNEPFNVAYAKAEQKRKEMAQRMAQQQASYQALNRPPVGTVGDMSSGRQEEAGPSVTHRRTVPSTSAAINVAPSESSLKSSSRSFAPQKDASSKPFHDNLSSRVHTQPRATSKAKSDVDVYDYAPPRSQRKHSLEKDGDDASSKKSRSDVLEQTNVVAPDSSLDVADDEVINTSLPKTSRGAKRQAGSDEEIANLGSIGKKSGKRARRQSKKLQDSFKVDENDELMDLEHIVRGKKRDWAEAGSSFGGDDDFPVGGRGRKNRRQKRKSSASMDVETAIQARGTKRSFDVESTLGSDDEDGSISRSKLSRKRGKRMGTDSYDVSDVSMDDLTLDPSCAGRKTGEEWHANGETYKVGPDGRRLRQVLLMRRRSRYSMPEDSQHPDTQAHLEILIETWLNDDEYQAAAERGDVYVPSKSSKDRKELSSTAKSGKQLLWSTSQNGEISPKKAFKNSVVANVGVNGNPFERPSLTGYTKRISIGSDSPLPSPTGSPAIRQSKSYSKWEKQDLEAEAMAKLRKKLEEEKKVVTHAPNSKRVSFQLPSSGSETASPAPSIASSSSAPASFPALSTPSKPGEPPLAPATSNLFARPQTNGDTAKAPASSTITTSSSEPGQVKPPTITLTPPQHLKEQTPATATKAAFGVTPLSSQTTPTPKDNKNPSAHGLKPAEHVTAPSAALPSMPSPFGQKTQDTFNATARSPSTTNMFAKPVGPSNVSVPAINGVAGGAPGFSFGIKGAAQADKTAEASSPFPFGRPADKIASSTASPFGAPAKEAPTPSSANAPSIGSAAGSTVHPPKATAPGQAISPFSIVATTNKTSDSINRAEQPASGTSSAAAPKFNFGFASRPVASPSAQAQTSASAPKPAPSTSPFSFGSNATTQNTAAPSGTQTAPTRTAPLTTSTPTLSFGTSAGPATASSTSGNSTGTKTDVSATGGVPAPTGFSFNFGASKPATSSSALSPFGSQPTSSPFGNQSSSSYPFGTIAKPSTAPPSPFGVMAPTFGNGPSATNTSTSSSPFGAPAKPAGEVPKPLFGFGQNSTTGTAPAAEKQENKAAFSFNFGATPATSTPAFGSTTAPNGSSGNVFGKAGTASSASPAFMFGAGAKPASSSFGTSAGGTNSNTSDTNTNVFGSSNGTSVFGGQK